MFGRYFDTTQIRLLAQEIVAELEKLLPAADTGTRTRKVQDRLARLDLKVAQRISELSAGGGLNWYQKAKLGSLVREGLDRAAYPEDFARQYVMDLVALAATAGRRKP